MTGSTGFIGSHLVKMLLRERHDIHAVIIDDTFKDYYLKNNVHTYHDCGSTAGLIDYLSTHRFDGVVHLASCFLVEHSSSDIDALVNSNLLFSTRVLEAAVRSDVRWFINTGTYWQHYNNGDYNPVNLYAATKQAFQDIAEYYLQTSPIHFTTIKLNDTYGPGDTRKKIFNLWYANLDSGEVLRMSPGEQLMDIVYIDDVIDAYLAMISRLNNADPTIARGSSYAVSSKERVTLKKLAEIFEHTVGRKVNIEWAGRDYRPREVMVPWDRGVPVPGWTQHVSFEEGIKKVFLMGVNPDEERG